MNWFEPAIFNDSSHVEASETKNQFEGGWFANPIFVNGKYPDIMRQKIDAKSEAQGFTESRLPHFTEEESLEILGSADFLGLNFYTTSLVYPTPPDQIDPSKMNWDVDSDVSSFKGHFLLV